MSAPSTDGAAPAAAIGAHGVIGDLHTAALVAVDGSLDWCCLPRFDAPSVFAALLDPDRGGKWRIAPAVPAVGEQHYLPGTNVLVTSFRVQEGGVLEVVDFMPVGPGRGRLGRVMRRVRAARGAIPAEILWEPRLEYGACPTRVVPRKHGVLATDRYDDVVTVCASDGVRWTLHEASATARLNLAEGQHAWFVMTHDDDEVRPLAAHEPDAALEAAVKWWDAWSSTMRYDGPYRAEVERSALALKLCCYEPSGAVIAAPTTSLPESQSGGRTWDYRYTWLRDAAFVLQALDRLGYDAETDAFMGFLRRVCRREDGRYLQIMYAPDGTTPPPERTLDHLKGWRGIGPVRIGNGAVDQFQLDVYGELLATAAEWSQRNAVTEGTWTALRGLVDWTARHWGEPDNSIWEPRLDRRHHVFSKIMAWVALDRGATIAEQHGLSGDIAGWRREAEQVKAEVLAHGVDPQRQAFVQVYGEPQLDAALLIVPKVRFLERGDPRVRGTLEAVRRELATPCEELIFRYRTADGLAGDEGAFLFTSCLMIQNVALTSRLEDAERMFRNLLRRAGPLGLFAEELDPMTGEQMGNYPQALTHAALINTAVIFERLRAGAPPAPQALRVGMI